MNRSLYKTFSAFTVLALMLVGLQVPRVNAAPTELFFSEYIEGSSFNKALEIYNGTGAAVDLSTYSVELYSNGAAAPSASVALSGTLADGDVFVMAHGSAAAAILAVADLTNSSVVNFNGDDAIVLRNSGTVVDAFGQVGVDPGNEWPGGGLDDTLRRAEAICAGDTTPDDAFDAALEWVVFPQNTFDGLGAHTVNCSDADLAPSVSNTFPVEGATNFPTGANLTVTFSEPVDVTMSWFGLTCSVSGTVAATFTGGPTTFTIDPGVALADGESCTLTVFADQVSDQDANDPPDNLELNFTVAFSSLDYCAADYTPIYDIQGSGTAAAITGDVLTQGVVVGDFEGAGGIGGFYLQDAIGDDDPATSDGIFVYTGSADTVSEGQLVSVAGFARERFNQTALQGADANDATVPATNIVVCGTGSVDPVDVTMPFPDATYLERFEGMLVRFPQALVISEFFNYDRFGEIVLTLDRQFQPTAVFEPDSTERADLAASNFLNRITLDDGLGIQNPSFTRHPNGEAFSLENRFRHGDTVANAVGVLGFDFGLYRIQPTAPADYTAVNLRPEAPEDVGGNITVAAFNVLNYFTTLDDGVNDICGPLENQECRGADNAEEFTRQRDKIIAALVEMNADVVGLIEIENHPADVPTADLVEGLNDVMGAGTYAYIATGAIGTDAIRQAFIYKPGSVSPVGDYAILDAPSFTNPLGYVDEEGNPAEQSRPALAQTFQDNETGGIVTVVVNHLKSKGSECGPGDDDPVQGNCNLTRTLGAQALVDWLATDPTSSEDEDFLIIGDLNAYDKEDPIDVILEGADDTLGTGDDYIDLLFHFVGEFAYTYLFDGQLGYLDYALAIQDLLGEVTGATVWHINADEPDLIDYDTSFKSAAQDALYAPDPYRSSDHDPVIVGLELIATCNGLPATIIGTPGD
ncbi:MAG TPA: ExeM/NucH family extracellular endonuclease, partial [Anaerolineales bacterium]|nr:ExeM/NucH family extracellular endonuclease [Anaerolineales bacterium]